MINLSSYKAILFDVDRTLITGESTWPEGLQDKLKQLDDMGLRMGVCTGRPYQRLQPIIPFFRTLKNSTLHIVSGGGEIVDAFGKVYFQQTVPNEIVQTMIKKFIDRGRMLIATKDAIYLNEPYYSKGVDTIDDCLKPILAVPNQGVTMVIARQVNLEDPYIKSIKDKVQIKFMHTAQGEPYVDVTALNATKGSALKVWSELTKIDLDQVMGFGDNHNDFEFLQEVGYGVALGNAEPEIKSVSDQVIGNIQAGGLTNFLNDLINKKEDMAG